MADEAPPEVGRRIRELRQQQGLSLRALAERSSVSINTISLIERGQSSPTVATLHQLAAALGIRIVDFFGPEEEIARVVFVPAGRRKRTHTPGALIESLGTGLAGQRIQPFLVTLEAGAGSSGEPISHCGQEFVMGLEGRIEYIVNGQTYHLGEGDALLFEASLPHYWRNPTSGAARLLLILEAREGRGAPLLEHLER